LNSLSELKSIVTQMETQITEDICSSFITEVATIAQQYHSSTSLSALFNMMQSLVKYLNSRKKSAHKESVPVLHSIVDVADSIIQQPDFTPQQKQLMVKRQIELYKLLQNKLSSTPAVNPADIQDLKAVILAIDWEISDSTLSNFEAEINRQLIIFSAYSIHHTFLKMIQNIGRYVATHKAKAHANSIFFLRSVFKNFEYLIDSPDMPFKKKKKLLENDIKLFNDFKLKISKPIPPKKQSQDVPDEDIAPALSHIKPSLSASADQDTVSSITALEIDTLPEDINSQEITPALSGKRKPKDGPRDVMGDLFSIKESPADELLDAIHLLDVHGSNPDKSMALLNSSNDLDTDGAESYTPQRIDTDPIPEIGDRLDEFFNLDTNDSEPEKLTQPVSSEQAFEPEPGITEDPEDGIVPFGSKDDNEDATLDDTKEPMLSETIIRLKSYFKSFDRVVDESWYRLVHEDITFLKKNWQSDSDKLALLDILESVLLLLDIQIKEASTDSSKPEKEPPKGFWQKIKAIFSF